MALTAKGAPPLATARLPFVQPRTGMWREGYPRSVPLAAAAAPVVAAWTVAVGYLWWRGRGDQEVPDQGAPSDAGEALAESPSAVARGYQRASASERAAFNLFGSFAVTSGTARLVTYVWDQRRSVKPFARLIPSSKMSVRVHHYVPGIVVGFASGAAAIVVPSPRWAPWLGVPFGVGTALALDEAPRLLGQDLYWSRERLLYGQAFLGLAGALVCGARVFSRGARVATS